MNYDDKTHDLTPDELEVVSGGMEHCKPGQFPTIIRIRSTGEVWVGCDGGGA